VSRRGLLRLAAGACAAAVGLGAYARYIEPYWYEIVERPLPLHNLPPETIGLKLVQLSDIHVGKTDADYLRHALRSVERLEPDILVITGDFISYHTVGGAMQLARAMRDLKLAKIATLGCLGNHDYGHKWRDARVGDAVARVLKETGVRVLRNETANVRGVQFLGLDDLWGPNFAPARMMNTLSPGAPSIALCHNPDACDLPFWNKYRGWILSGHTHGGQCRPPFLPPPILPVSNRRYVAGEYALSGGRTLYINRALGWARQIRLNVRPEITLFRLAGA